MLLFKKEHIFPILLGKKIQTRRVWKKPRANIGTIHLAKTGMLEKRYFAKLEITNVFMEKIGDISEIDSIKEGYKGKEVYLNKFFAINKTKLKKLEFPWKDLEVYVIEWKFPVKQNNFLSWKYDNLLKMKEESEGIK